MTKILVLTHEYPPIGGGGGRVALDICEGLSKRGHDVRVLTSHIHELPVREDLNDVKLIRLRTGRKEAYKAKLRDMAGYVFECIWQGLREIRTWHPDIMHVHFAVPAGASAWVLSNLTGVPYVLTAHLGDVPGGVPEKTGKWFRWIFPFTPPIWKRASRIAAVSEFTRQIALQHYPVPIQVIYNGVDLKTIQPKSIAIQKPPRIIFAGRFMEQKNPVELVEVLKTVRDLPWECVMLGDGPLRSEVEETIERCQMTKRFYLPGWVTPEEVIEWFSKSDILFMPSRSEGLPVVGVQAVSMGLAVVISRVGGCIDLVEDEQNGSLIDRDDRQGFSKALRKLLENPDILLEARQASRRLAVKFDLDSVVESYEQIFNQVIQPVQNPNG